MSINSAQLLILAEGRTCLLKGRRQITEAQQRQGQHPVRSQCRAIGGLPTGFDLLLRQPALQQVLQCLQVDMTDHDLVAIAGRLLAPGSQAVEPIAGRVETIVSQAFELPEQGLQLTCDSPHRGVLALTVECFQLLTRRIIQARRRTGTRHGQLLDAELQGRRGSQGHFHSRDQWRHQHAKAQVTCVFFEQLQHSNPWPLHSRPAAAAPFAHSQV